MSMESPLDPNPPVYSPPPAMSYAPPPAYAPPLPVYYAPPLPAYYPPAIDEPAPSDEFIIPPGAELASVGRRVAAYFLSLLLVIVTLVIGYVIWGLIAWRQGRTPAQQLLRMRTWRIRRQQPAGFGRMALREIVGRFVELLVPPVVAIISLVLMVSRRDRRTIHDLIAGTVVLHELKPPRPAIATPEIAAPPIVAPPAPTPTTDVPMADVPTPEVPTADVPTVDVLAETPEVPHS